MIFAISTSIKRRAGLGTVLSAMVISSAALGYTPEQQQACSGDAFRICSSEIPDVDRVTVCMIRNKAQLSPGCRALFRPDPEPVMTPVTTRRPLVIRPVRVARPVSAKPSRIKQPVKRASRN